MSADNDAKPARARGGAKAVPAIAGGSDAQRAEKGSKASTGRHAPGQPGAANPSSQAKLAARATGEDPAPRSAAKGKAGALKASGTAQVTGATDTTPKPEEEMPKQAPLRAKGAPKPAASKAAVEGKPDDGTSSATAGKAEKMEAEAAHAGEPAGRGRRKAAARVAEGEAS